MIIEIMQKRCFIGYTYIGVPNAQFVQLYWDSKDLEKNLDGSKDRDWNLDRKTYFVVPPMEGIVLSQQTMNGSEICLVSVAGNAHFPGGDGWVQRKDVITLQELYDSWQDNATKNHVSCTLSLQRNPTGKSKSHTIIVEFKNSGDKKTHIYFSDELCAHIIVRNSHTGAKVPAKWTPFDNKYYRPLPASGTLVFQFPVDLARDVCGNAEQGSYFMYVAYQVRETPQAGAYFWGVSNIEIVNI